MKTLVWQGNATILQARKTTSKFANKQGSFEATRLDFAIQYEDKPIIAKTINKDSREEQFLYESLSNNIEQWTNKQILVEVYLNPTQNSRYPYSLKIVENNNLFNQINYG